MFGRPCMLLFTTRGAAAGSTFHRIASELVARGGVSEGRLVLVMKAPEGPVLPADADRGLPLPLPLVPADAAVVGARTRFLSLLLLGLLPCATTTAAPRKSRKSKSSAEELRGCDDAETRLLLEVRGTILLRRSPQVAAPCRTLCSVAVQRAESSVQSPRRFLSLSHLQYCHCRAHCGS